MNEQQRYTSHQSIRPLHMDAGPATPETFDERGYLAANLDVMRAVAKGMFESGRRHFELIGVNENRRLRRTTEMDAMRAVKAPRVEAILRSDMPHERNGLKFNFLSPELKEAMKIVDTENVATSDYDETIRGFINEFPDGLVLDCGCGRRDSYYPNVVNYEIVDYDTTDVLGVGEELPFKDSSFDAVISIAVLEHVYDPFRCAREIVRVLKPGGDLFATVPFLQPVHGYPHHYFNMTGQGLRTLFERYGVQVTRQEVPRSALPICALTWIVQSWAAGLPADARERFLRITMSDLMANPQGLLDEPWVKDLPTEKLFELASGTAIFGRKPGQTA